MAQEFFYQTPKCTSGLTTVNGCLSKLNFFNRAYALSPQSKQDCAGNPVTSQLRDYTIYDTIICGAGDDMNLFGIFDRLFGANEMDIPATSVWRKTQCRTNWSFKIKSAVTAPPGASVTVSLSQDSHFLNGTTSLPTTNAPIHLPGANFPMGIITNVDRTVPYAHTITITPLKPTQEAITIGAGQRLFFGGGARYAKGGSCPVEETSVQMPGKLQRAQMALIRADWCIERELNMGYDGVLQFAMGLLPDGTVAECWDAVAASIKRQAMKITRDQLLLVGRRIDNTNLSTVVEGYEAFEGYIPSVLNGGGINLTYDPFSGFNMFGGMRTLSRFADANRSCREYFAFVSPEFRRGITDNWNTTVGGQPLGLCTYEAFKRTGGDGSVMAQYLGYDSYKVDNFTVHIKDVPIFADNTSYGISGYAFSNMAMFMPACPIKTVSGATAPAVELFYPKTQCDSGGYFEQKIDYRETNGCMKVGGFMYQQFTALYHCVEYHGIVRGSSCP